MCGGQDLSICFYASGTYVTVDNIVITDAGTAATVPVIGTAPYTKTFDESTTSTSFYGPYTSSPYSSTSNNKFSYFTYYGNNNGSGAYTVISSSGGNGGKVNSTTTGYCTYSTSTTADNNGIPAPSGYPCIITKELNTSTCTGTTATLRFAFKQTYAGYISDENYSTYCPRVFYATTADGTTTGYSWTQATVNYYFPNGQWWYAVTSLPKAQNVIVAFTTGTAAQAYYFDDIKVVNKDCSIAIKTGEAITCTSNPGMTSYALNTPYTFTIANATTGATKWKWIVRDLTTAGNPFYYGTTAGATPAIISGQTSQTATINFGTTGGNSYRVMCIPYNSDYGTDAAPTDAGYAKISIYSSSLTQASCALSGTYTIGGASPNYASFAAAVSDLVNCGVSGPVIFNVRNGTYTEQISIPVIAGVSATNTITFQAESGVAANVTLQSAAGSGTANDYVVQLNGADYIIFNNLSVTYSGASNLYGRVFWIAGGASYCTISNCTITGTTGTANGGCELIYCNNTGLTNGTDNTISNNTLTNGSYGIYYQGVLGSNTEPNLSIFENTISGQPATSVYLKFLSNTQVYNNTINNNSGSTSYYGIDLESCTGDATHYNNVYNNWVTSPYSCIWNNSSTYLGVYYNNANTTGSGATSASSTFYTSGGAVTNTVKINNNIFVNSGAYVAIYIGGPTYINDIDNNDYYAYNSGTGVVSKYIGAWNSLNMARMADFKFNAQLTNAAFEVNSAGINPLFTSSTNLHANFAGFANKGTPISGITTDINGAGRDGSTPDIGAEEGSGTTHAALTGGTYTIGGSSPSYATIYEAAEELNYYGVSGAVIFDIRNGTYTEQIAIGAISGANSSNTVTFQSEGQDSTLVTLQYGCTLDNPFEHFTFQFVKASYITVKWMTIAATDASRGNVIVMIGAANNNKVLDCKLIGVASTATGTTKQ